MYQLPTTKSTFFWQNTATYPFQPSYHLIHFHSQQTTFNKGVSYSCVDFMVWLHLHDFTNSKNAAVGYHRLGRGSSKCQALRESLPKPAGITEKSAGMKTLNLKICLSNCWNWTWKYLNLKIYLSNSVIRCLWLCRDQCIRHTVTERYQPMGQAILLIYYTPEN